MKKIIRQYRKFGLFLGIIFCTSLLTGIILICISIWFPEIINIQKVQPPEKFLILMGLIMTCFGLIPISKPKPWF